MKRTICALLALICLACPAWAEVTLESVSPTPSAAPAGVAFSGDGISLTLPSGLEPLSQEALEGYAAAVEHDFPGAAQISLAAADEARGDQRPRPRRTRAPHRPHSLRREAVPPAVTRPVLPYIPPENSSRTRS